MATWQGPIDSQTDPDAPLTAELGKRWDNNCIAIAEGASGAPVVEGAWHPYNAVAVDDGNDGLIYDHAVSGSVASVETPVFADGYEYRVVCSDIRNGAPNVNLECQIHEETDNAYNFSLILGDSGVGVGEKWWGEFHSVLPRVAREVHSVVGHAIDGSAAPNAFGPTCAGGDVGSVQKVDKLRVRFTSGNIIGGKVYLFRRKDYAT